MKKDNVRIISKTKLEIEVEVPQEEVAKEFEKVVKQFSSSAKIHGFRPGKAPVNLVKQRFYPEIQKSFLDSIVPDAFEREMKTQDFIPISLPEIKDLHFRENEPLRFKAEVEIWPDFKLPDYRKIRVKKKEVSVTDDEMAQSLRELQQNSAEYIPVEGRGVKDGDYVVVEVKGRDVKTKRFLPTEKVIILAGHVDNEKKLNESIRGMKSSERRAFVIDYDKNHQNKKLRGKTIEYAIMVDSIKEKSLPEINDDLAKDLGEFENLEALKEKIKKQILLRKENLARNEMAGDILENIAEKVSLELPPSLVERENISVLRKRLEQMPKEEITKEKIEELKQETRMQAEKNLRNHLILRKIAQAEGFSITDEDEEEEMKAIAKANNVPLAKVVDSLNKQEGREELRSSILMKKTVDFLLKQAIIE